MRKWVWGGVIGLVFLGGAGVIWLVLRDAPEPVEPMVIDLVPEEEPAEAPQVFYPVPALIPEVPAPMDESAEETAPDPGLETGQATPVEPLPPLEESDAQVEAKLTELVEDDRLHDWLREEEIIRRMVVTINSLDEAQLPLRFWPVRHVEGQPDVEVVDAEEDVYAWVSENHARYLPAVRLLSRMEPEAVAELYFHYYPLFQAAYDELGYPDAYFNDRFVEIIDHLLAGPDPERSYELKRPEVLYEFADPALEEESWGRKVLLRMGPANAAEVKDWLRSLRAELMDGA